MIQRQQSLWLLLSAISAFLSYKFPFYTGNKIINNMSTGAELDGASTFFLLVLTGLSLVLSVATIFLYKDRKLQLKLTLGGAVLSLLIIIIYFTETKDFVKPSNLSLSSVFVFAMIAGYIMAARGIWKDEKLVKSLDKLR